MPIEPLRILHAIHDFLPRHRAGSEIYAAELARRQASRHHVTVLAAEYDPARRHGHVEWRVHDGVPVAEIVNNWVCPTFEETYRPPLIGDRIASVLRAVQPDVVHVHNLLNLSFDLPALARRAGARVVATLHDYTLVCPSGGQRLHRADRHVCTTIDVDRCSRCFGESPFAAQMTVGTTPKVIQRVALTARRLAPGMATRAAGLATAAVPRRATPQQISARLDDVRRVYDEVDLFVSPSPSLAREFAAAGMPREKIVVSDYGFTPLPRRPAVESRSPGAPLRLGFVGTIVWHKGVHVLVDALRMLPRDSFELKIFGDETMFPDYTKSLRTSAEGLPVQFSGRFDAAQMAGVYRQIDVLVVPSIWLENSPLVIHEAFMSGIPVVGAKIGGIVDLIEDGVNGALYDPQSATALAAVLRSLIDDRDRVAAMAARVSAVKTIDDDVREWDERYASVLATAPATGPSR